jgi:peroxiredoxin
VNDRHKTPVVNDRHKTRAFFAVPCSYQQCSLAQLPIYEQQHNEQQLSQIPE